MQTRLALIKEDIEKDKNAQRRLKAHAKALGHRVKLLQKQKLAREITAQAQQYAAAERTLENQAKHIKEVAHSLSERSAAVDKEAAPLFDLEAKELADAVGVGHTAHKAGGKKHAKNAKDAKHGAAGAAPAAAAAAAPEAAAPAAPAAAPAS